MAATLARFSRAPQSATKRYYQHINKFSAQFAFATDMAMLTLGGYLKQKEHLSARLGDVLSSLYMASMVLKHYENQGRPAADLPLVEWSLRSLLYKAQEQLHGFLRNFPNRWVAGAMRIVIFPRGRTYSAPSDRLGRAIVAPLMMPSETRDRLSAGIYTTVEPGNPIGLLQQALVAAMVAEPLEKRIRVEGVKTGTITALDLPSQIEQALQIGLITAAEAQTLRDYDRKVMEIIDVDDFPTASYRAERIVPQPDGALIEGTLTLKDRALKVPPLRLTAGENEVRIEGRFEVDRAEANLGMESDPLGEYVSKKILVEVRVVARPPASP